MILSLIILWAFLLLWFFGSIELAELETVFDENTFNFDLDSNLKSAQSKLSEILPKIEKLIIWHEKPNKKKTVSIVYLRGFLDRSEETRPVLDRMAQSLRANLYFARLIGQGPRWPKQRPRSRPSARPVRVR